MLSANVEEKVKALAAAVDAEKSAANEHLFRPARLARFVENSNLDVVDAEKQFRAMLNWRVEVGMDELRQALEGKPWAVDSVEFLSEWCQIVPQDVFGYTAQGDMMALQCDGAVNLARLDAMSDEKLQKLLYQMMELRADTLDRRSEELQRLAKVVQIRDLSKLVLQSILGNVRLIGRLQRLMRVSLGSYPETIGKVVLLSPPMGFEALYALLTPLMSERVREKVLVFGVDKIVELFKLVGCDGLVRLAKLRSIGNACDVAAGYSAVGYAPVKAGEKLEWSFAVAPSGLDIGFKLQFLPAAAGSSILDLQPLKMVDGACSGSYEAEADGILWCTWSNEHSWLRGKRIEVAQGLLPW
eukprot:TRINITY_DN22129_c0_g1_i2.p1 TRINITY_DN22129_c0_g1~~TRINITY_DN22129_c0_g1_i2.p1  ORF type:complete len:356 (+),score=96.08 TRINITY_DN22129_c0_g1_i2:86-1153(+)